MGTRKTNDRLVEEYLAGVHRALQDLPRARRDPIMEDIREHIRIARAQMPSEDEAQIRQLLEDLGTAEAIRQEAGLPSNPRVTWGDRAAPWLLLFGGFVFLVGWIAGVVLLWHSSIWNTRDKILATLIWPGGLATVVYASGLTTSVAPSPPSTTHVVGAIAAVIASVVFPIVINVRLMRIERRWAWH